MRCRTRSSGEHDMIGKWILINEEEYYNVGEIIKVIEVVGEMYFLVRVRPVSGSPPSQRIYFIGELTAESGSAVFDTEEEMDAYVSWLEAPDESKPRIVSMREKR